MYMYYIIMLVCYSFTFVLLCFHLVSSPDYMYQEYILICTAACIYSCVCCTNNYVL